MILVGYAVFFTDGFGNTQHNDIPSLRTSAYTTLAIFHR
jgi:hypothetical protein